jgi:Ca2+-binding EF-hand superfamily protein
MSLSEEQKKNLKVIFETIDTDKSGTVSRSEYFTYLKAAQSSDTTEEEAGENFESVAHDGTTMTYDVCIHFSFI